MDDIIRVRDISKSFGKKTVLRKITFEVKKGEILGLIGMSGVGKTTLLQILMGTLTPNSGEVFYLPENTKKDTNPYKLVTADKHMKTVFGYASQNPSFYPELTVEENITYFGSLYRVPRKILKANMETVLRLVALSKERATLAGDLSGGMGKRLDVACALIHDPAVIIFDEPTADLDPLLGNQMWELIKKINSTGTTVIVASHFLQEMEELCDRLAILHDKSMVDIGTITQLKKRYQATDEIHIETTPADYESLIPKIKARRLSIVKIEELGFKMVVHSRRAEDVLQELLQIIKASGETLLSVEVKKPDLLKVFVSLTKR